MPTEQQSQEDQINAAVVGRGVRLPMGDPVEVVEPVQEPARILEREPQPEVEAPPKGNGSSKSAAMPHVEEMGLMGDSTSPSTHKQGRRWGKPDAEDIAPMGETGERPVKRGKKKPLTKSQKIFVASGVLALVLVAASNLIPKEMPTTAPLAQTGPGADATAPMPKDSAPLLIELTPEDVELLKAAKLQKAKEAAGALRAIESDGPLPTDLSNVPAAAPESLTPLSAGAVVAPASANALHAQEVKPSAKMPSTAPVANQQAEPPSKPVDRNTASMDIPLTQDQGVPSDIAGLKDVSERANKAPPVAKLAAPLEESKAPPKAEAKHDQKQEAKPPAVEALKKQPAVTTTAAKMEATAQKKN